MLIWKANDVYREITKWIMVFGGTKKRLQMQ